MVPEIIGYTPTPGTEMPPPILLMDSPNGPWPCYGDTCPFGTGNNLQAASHSVGEPVGKRGGPYIMRRTEHSKDMQLGEPIAVEHKEIEHLQVSPLLIKPDGVREGMHRQIIDILKRHAIQVLHETGVTLTPEDIKGLYGDMVGMPHYDNGNVQRLMTAGPSHLLVVAGPQRGFFDTMRQEIVGDGPSGTGIRGARLDYLSSPHHAREAREVVVFSGNSTGQGSRYRENLWGYNMIHSPRNAEEAQRDLAILLNAARRSSQAAAHI